jgi:hypothetical protein
VVSQPADSENRLAAIVSTAGISLPQIRRISSRTPISAISQLREAYCRYKSQTWFPVGNVGKLSLMDLNRLSAISSLQREGHILWLKPLKPFFCDLKSKFALILEIKYQRSMGMEDLLIDISYDLC